MKTIQESLKQLNTVTCPEDLFGINPLEVRESYREWCKNTHEDLFPEDEKAAAHEAFVLLGLLYGEAEEKISKNTYGDRKPRIEPVYIDTKKNKYKLSEILYSGAVSDIFKASADKNYCIKIVRNYSNNDLLKNEADKINKIRKSTDDPKILQHIPDLVESCALKDGSVVRGGNVFEENSGFITLQKIIDAYPKGIDPRDMAWMFNRVMSALFITHENKIVHGAIIPNHILINVETHNAILIDWCYSVNAGENIKVVDPEYKDYYPQEVFLKQPAKLGLDLYMLASCMVKLLGGDVNKKSFPKSVPAPIKNLLLSCLLGYIHRCQDVIGLYKDFSEILKALYGPRKFRTFVMPDSTKKEK